VKIRAARRRRGDVFRYRLTAVKTNFVEMREEDRMDDERNLGVVHRVAPRDFDDVRAFGRTDGRRFFSSRRRLV